MATPAQGAKSAIGATPLQLVATATPLTYGVTVKAAAANTANVYVGLSSGVTPGTADATDGFQLAAGDSVFVPLACAADASKVYVVSDGTGQKVFWLAV